VIRYVIKKGDVEATTRFEPLDDVRQPAVDVFIFVAVVSRLASILTAS
jgi:hypothetical protein